MSFFDNVQQQLGMGSAAEPATPATQEGGAMPKVLLCGRERKVIAEGRYRFVTIKGEKVSITKAREMDKKYKADQKAKAAKDASKKSKKSKN